MSTSIGSDTYGILEEMETLGCKIQTHALFTDHKYHGIEYFDKKSYLERPWIGQKIGQIMTNNIDRGSIIIAPETSGSVILGKIVANLTQSIIVHSIKINGIHTFTQEEAGKLKQGLPIIVIDDIHNNGKTGEQIRHALEKFGLNIHKLLVMIDRNPLKSGENTDFPVDSLASVQMTQWHESIVPQELKETPISGAYGFGRSLVGRSMTQVNLGIRFDKENLGYHFDDKKYVVEEDGMLKLCEKDV